MVVCVGRYCLEPEAVAHRCGGLDLDPLQRMPLRSVRCRHVESAGGGTSQRTTTWLAVTVDWLLRSVRQMPKPIPLSEPIPPLCEARMQLVFVAFVAFGIWHLAFGIWHLAFGIWHFGIWTLDFGLWHLAFWHLDFGLWTLDFTLLYFALLCLAWLGLALLYFTSLHFTLLYFTSLFFYFCFALGQSRWPDTCHRCLPLQNRRPEETRRVQPSQARCQPVLIERVAA